MAYFFPSHNREVFKKTFLKDIRLSFTFNEVPFEKANHRAIIELFKRTFKINITEEQIKGEIIIKSEVELLCFTSTLSSVSVKMDFPSYKVFNDAKKWIDLIREYMNVLGVEKVNKVCFYKYNELNYSLEEGNKNVTDAIKQVFSNNLLNYKNNDNEKSFDDFKSELSGLSRWERKHVIDDVNDTKSSMTIEYGFKEKTEADNKGVITMKSYIESIDDFNLEIKDIPDVLSVYNQLLDSAFQWCINDMILKQMR